MDMLRSLFSSNKSELNERIVEVNVRENREEEFDLLLKFFNCPRVTLLDELKCRIDYDSTILFLIGAILILSILLLILSLLSCRTFTRSFNARFEYIIELLLSNY